VYSPLNIVGVMNLH